LYWQKEHVEALEESSVSNQVRHNYLSNLIAAFVKSYSEPHKILFGFPLGPDIGRGSAFRHMQSVGLQGFKDFDQAVGRLVISDKLHALGKLNGLTVVTL